MPSKVHLNRAHDLAVELDELEVLATPSPADLPPTRMREVLARALDALDVALRSHFTFEEQGGYMREVLAARPSATRRVTALREQHAALRERLNELRARVLDGHLEPLQRELVELVAAVRAHEDAERDLVDGALEDDAAAVD
jgi:hemerythrin HHE cation binding domain-containing protein